MPIDRWPVQPGSAILGPGANACQCAPPLAARGARAAWVQCGGTEMPAPLCRWGVKVPSAEKDKGTLTWRWSTAAALIALASLLALSCDECTSPQDCPPEGLGIVQGYVLGGGAPVSSYIELLPLEPEQEENEFSTGATRPGGTPPPCPSVATSSAWDSGTITHALAWPRTAAWRHPDHQRAGPAHRPSGCRRATVVDVPPSYGSAGSWLGWRSATTSRTGRLARLCSR